MDFDTIIQESDVCIMKKIVSLALTILFLACLTVCVSAEIPTPWFDLSFDSGKAADASGNCVVLTKGGTLGETSITFDGKEYPVFAYTGNQETHYLEVNLPFGDSSAKLGEFLLKGCTFEIFFQTKDAIEGNFGLMSSCYGGGVSLYLFDSTTALYVGSASKGYYVAANGRQTINVGELNHLVGVIDEAGKLTLYQNGKKADSVDFDIAGGFLPGSAKSGKLGIGVNISETSENLGGHTEYRVLDANIYDVSLTEEEVTMLYLTMADGLTGGGYSEKIAEQERLAAELAAKERAEAEAAALAALEAQRLAEAEAARQAAKMSIPESAVLMLNSDGGKSEATRNAVIAASALLSAIVLFFGGYAVYKRI